MTRVTVPTHYYQFDQQGVAFNMWYLAFLEYARNGYLASVGYSLADLLESGHDIQLVHVNVDWYAPCRYGDDLEIEARVARVGATSLSFEFTLKVARKVIAVASSVYVIVDRQISGKSSVPEALRAAIAAKNLNTDLRSAQ